MTKILLPIDDSKFSEEALHTVVRQYSRRGTEVRVLHVVEPVSAYVSAEMMPHMVDQLDSVEQDRKQQGKTLVQEAARKLRAAGFKTSFVLTMGKPADDIVEEAKRWKADVIVMGSYGLHGLNRLLMGSVSESVSKHADCTVEIVRLRNPAA